MIFFYSFPSNPERKGNLVVEIYIHIVGMTEENAQL